MKNNILENAMFSFSRHPSFDLQVYLEQVINYKNIVEFGAGTGRLCEFWLSENKKVFAIENNINSISILKSKYQNEINKKEILLFTDINQLNYFDDKAILIAPFNLIFHFKSIEIFLEIIKTSFKKNIETIILDFDELSENDINNLSDKHIRTSDEFIEKGELVNPGQYHISWFYENNIMINNFMINLHSADYILSTIKQEIPNIIVTMLTHKIDIHGTKVLFVKIEMNKDETV